jgi:hypothetical protein
MEDTRSLAMSVDINFAYKHPTLLQHAHSAVNKPISTSLITADQPSVSLPLPITARTTSETELDIQDDTGPELPPKLEAATQSSTLQPCQPVYSAEATTAMEMVFTSQMSLRQEHLGQHYWQAGPDQAEELKKQPQRLT